MKSPSLRANPNPSGLCRCGCGEKTLLSTATVAKRNVVKGYPLHWVRGHSRRILPEDGTLRCTVCKTRKSVDDFYASAKAASGKMGRCKPCHEAKMAASAAKATTQTPEERKRKARCSTIKSMYGITLAEFEEMAERQGGACLICKVIPKRRLDIDHCHTFGHVRGLLCGHCNKGLGHFKDDPDLLLVAVDYLRRTAEPAPGAPAPGRKFFRSGVDTVK